MSAPVPAPPRVFRQALLLAESRGATAATLAERCAAWAPGVDERRYGEPLVASAMHALRSAGADLLALEWPAPGDSGRRALAWSALEAARRLGGDLQVALLSPRADGPTAGNDAAAPAAVRWLAAKALDDALAALWRDGGGLQAEDFDAHAAARVSVVMRSMDRATLEAALDSVAWQTHRPVEVVVVNARGGAHRRLDAHRAGVPVRIVGGDDGAPLARPRAANAGLLAAQGEHVLFLDDDDILLPDHLAKLVAALARSPEAAAAYADVDYGRTQPDGWHSHHRFEADYDPVRLCFENYLPIHAVLFRRRWVDQGARVDERLLLLEDWDFWLQIAAFGPFVRAPGVSARYHAGSDGGSEVFEDSPLAQRSRAILFAKWQQRLPSDLYVALMVRLQAHYRGEAYTKSQLRIAHDEVTGLRAILAARDAEIASFREALAQRDEQARTAREHAASLAQVLATRDAELDSLRAEGPLRALWRTLHRKHHVR